MPDLARMTGVVITDIDPVTNQLYLIVKYTLDNDPQHITQERSTTSGIGAIQDGVDLVAEENDLAFY